MSVSFREIAILALILLHNYLPAQIISVIPERPRATDLVTIIFDASKGNQALLNYQNDVFVHTGVIVGTAENPSGWEYVQGDWGVPDPRMRMRYLGNNKYQIKFRIKEFYDLPEGVDFLQMSFVFRNSNGSIIATEKDGSDIYYPDLDLFEFGPLEQAHGKDGENLNQMTDITHLDDGSIVIRDDNQALVVRPYADDLINLSYFPKGDVSISSTRSNNIEPKILGKINRVRNDFEITLKDSFSLRIFTNPIRLELYRDELLLMSDEKGCFYDNKDPLIGDMVGFRSTIQPLEALYETGPSFDKINRRGKRYYNFLGTSQKASNQLDQLTFPFLYSSKGYGLFINSSHEGYLDLGEKEKSIMEIGVRDSMLSWYIIVGDKPKDIVKTYSRLIDKKTIPTMSLLEYTGYPAENVEQVTRIDSLPSEAEQWQEIQKHLRYVLAQGVGGNGFTKPFEGGLDDENDELFLRSLQYGAFSPLMIGKDVSLLAPGLRKNAERIIQLRQKFLPYNYTLSWENITLGLPFARPMYFHYPDDPETKNLDNQYLWGENLLVAPIFEKAETQRAIYFPSATWYDFFTSSVITEKGWHNVPVSNGHIPIYAKGGSFIPLLQRPTNKTNGDTLEIHYFLDSYARTTTGKIYLDDGNSQNAYENGNYLLVEMLGKIDKKGISIKINTSGGGFPEMAHQHLLDVKINGVNAEPQKIFVNGKKIELIDSEEYSTEGILAYAIYLPGRKSLRIVWNWDQLPGEILVKGKFDE